jgi:phospholipid/cholesterol/gamma-HCH transport system substrate-binding protein
LAERQQWAETGLGAIVLVGALGFLGYALAHAGGLDGGGGYKLNARFGEVGALAPGAAVSVAGVKVGTVTAVTLDPKTFLADAAMTIDPKVRLPVDSTVKITQDSLLGGQHLSIEPGGSLDNLKPGASFTNTQGSVDLFGLIGSVLRPQGAGAGSAPAAGSSPAASAPAPGG